MGGSSSDDGSTSAILSSSSVAALTSTAPGLSVDAEARASPPPMAALMINVTTMISPTAMSPRSGHERLPGRSPVLVENLRTSCGLTSSGGGGTGVLGR